MLFSLSATKRYLLSICIGLLNQHFALAQSDTSTQAVNERLKRIEQALKSDPNLKKNYEDLTFYYGQMMKYRNDSAIQTGFKVSGYVDAYYAHYSDQLPITLFFSPGAPSLKISISECSPGLR